MPSRSGGGVYSRESPSFGGSVELTELDGLEGFVGLDGLGGLPLSSFFIIHIWLLHYIFNQRGIAP